MAEIQRLDRVETQALESGLDAAGRERLRDDLSRPVLARIKDRLDRDLGDEFFLPSSPLGKAIHYTLERWPGLKRYAETGWGHIEIDNNGVENAIRPTAVGKKNWLFIGHPKAGQPSAIHYTIIENCRLCEINPLEYLCDVMPKIMDHPAGHVAELLPRQWKAAAMPSQRKPPPRKPPEVANHEHCSMLDAYCSSIVVFTLGQVSPFHYGVDPY